jgi:hypothetical protein
MEWNTNWDSSAKKRAAISSINPSIIFHWTQESDEIIWAEDNTATIPTATEIDTEVARLDTEHTRLEYSRDRAKSYASIPDQLDYIYHHGVDAWKENMILPVKEKYPKE